MPLSSQSERAYYCSHIIKHAAYYPFCYLLVVAYRRLKTKENFKLLALKVAAVAYERWSLTRGSQCSDLAKKRLVFWKSGR